MGEAIQKSGLGLQYERSKALLEKFNCFQGRVTSECDLLEQELMKYVTQMDYELREHVQRKNGPKLENIDMRTFRKWMT